MTYTNVDLNGKTVLITGGAGFIGSNLALHIQEHFSTCHVVVLDAFVLGHFKNLLGFRGTCLAGDVASPQDLDLLTDYDFDYIFHQAAISDTTVTEQRRVVEVNTNTFHAILRLARRCQAPLVYASSAAVYGNTPTPQRVGHGEQPENVYGFSKLMMDQAAVRMIETESVPIVGLRYFNVYGPGETHKGNTASMILQLARQVLAGQRPRLFKHGEQRRDFVFVEDVIQANLKAISPRTSGVYNVGSGVARSFNEVLRTLCERLDCDVTAEYLDNPWSFYQQHTEADIAPTCHGLYYHPRYSLEDGIDAYLPELLRLAEQTAAPLRDAA